MISDTLGPEVHRHRNRWTFPRLEIFVIPGSDGTSFDRANLLEQIVDNLLNDRDWALIDAEITVAIDSDTLPMHRAVSAKDIRFISAEPGARALRSVIGRAAALGSDCLVVFGASYPNVEQIRRLQRTIRLDAMTGFAMPRISIAAGKHISTVEVEPACKVSWFYRDELQHIESTYVIHEISAPVTLIRADVVANLEPNLQSTSISGAVLEYLVQARRAGFMTVLDNRCVVLCPCEGDLTAARVGASDLARIRERYPCSKVAAEFVGRHHGLRYERLLSGLNRDKRATIPRLLLDCRNVSPLHNGTASATLGVFRGLSAIERPACQITVLIDSGAEKAFEMRERFPQLEFQFQIGTKEAFDCAIRLAQVWDRRTWGELHSWAPAIAATNLDCIAIDIAYVSNEEQILAFQFGAEFADGILHLSEYSKHLFRKRFAVHRSMRECVFHLSFALEEYGPEEKRTFEAVREGVFIVGNAYEHKHIRATVDLIGNAFPFVPIIALGLDHSDLGNVTALPGGSVSAGDMQRFYNTTKVIVFPSFYEGFGLPILEGLAAGAAVVARNGPLLDEVAENLAPGATLVPYEDVPGLVAAVGQLLHGRLPSVIALGGRIEDGQPLAWRGVAVRILDFAATLRDGRNAENWVRRDRALRQIGLP